MSVVKVFHLTALIASLVPPFLHQALLEMDYVVDFPNAGLKVLSSLMCPHFFLFIIALTFNDVVVSLNRSTLRT